MFGGGFFGGYPGDEPRAPKNVDNNKFYEVLGVEKTASDNDIKKAYRKKAVKMHPDKGGDPEQFKDLTMAYEVLSDQEKRKMYDKYGEEGIKDGVHPASDIFEQFFGGGIFGGGGRRREGPRKGEDVVHALKVSLEDLYNGKTAKLQLRKNVICDTCDGSGCKDKKAEIECSTCRGTGVRVAIRQLGPGMIQQMRSPCNVCHGKGTTVKDEDKCGQCKGEKVIQQNKLLEVFVDKGMKHGQKITFAGEADEAPGLVPGDIVIVLQQKEHDVFTRDGDHLHMKKQISLAEALCGTQFLVTHLDGRQLHVKNQDGDIIKPGQEMMIHGEGMPQHRNPFVKGDLIMKFEVVFPESLDSNIVSQLRAMLPKQPALQFDAQHVEECILRPFVASANARNQRREAYDNGGDDDDDDGHGHGPRVQCAQQ